MYENTLQWYFKMFSSSPKWVSVNRQYCTYSRTNKKLLVYRADFENAGDYFLWTNYFIGLFKGYF